MTDQTIPAETPPEREQFMLDRTVMTSPDGWKATITEALNIQIGGLVIVTQIDYRRPGDKKPLKPPALLDQRADTVTAADVSLIRAAMSKAGLWDQGGK